MAGAPPTFIRKIINGSATIEAAPASTRKIVVHALVERNKSATAVASLTLKSHGTNIGPTSQQTMSGLGAVLPFNPQGWMSCPAGQALSGVVTGNLGGYLTISIQDV